MVKAGHGRFFKTWPPRVQLGLKVRGWIGLGV